MGKGGGRRRGKERLKGQGGREIRRGGGGEGRKKGRERLKGGGRAMGKERRRKGKGQGQG